MTIDGSPKNLQIAVFTTAKGNFIFVYIYHNQKVENYKSGGTTLVRKFLKESEESCMYAELNSWEACMYNALIESDWFFTNALQKLEEYYIN